MNHFIRLFKEEEGQALTEYGLLVGLIAVACIAVIVAIGPELERLFRDILNALRGA
ncbi:pilus assembly protein Flp/PilA [Virgibacillus subterraneus]|uniref:Pilus assembly protein Flp/PilA n=2 Tax=Virgibacillus TaxID=84406 RepID=A0A1H0XY22_9BACI|nr:MULTISPECIES: Flp family type IVb pilin [Virgibacillus]SDQ07804.1 pilus assembly protein Flp/PilA [Virgibacillus salinus]SEP63402.1 pilus assembly protein Flp/PilA [Virgibacillus subterraneus]